jgi:hypothetical protein
MFLYLPRILLLCYTNEKRFATDEHRASKKMKRLVLKTRIGTLISP